MTQQRKSKEDDILTLEQKCAGFIDTECTDLRNQTRLGQLSGELAHVLDLLSG